MSTNIGEIFVAWYKEGAMDMKKEETVVTVAAESFVTKAKSWLHRYMWMILPATSVMAFISGYIFHK